MLGIFRILLILQNEMLKEFRRLRTAFSVTFHSRKVTQSDHSCVGIFEIPTRAVEALFRPSTKQTEKSCFIPTNQSKLPALRQDTDKASKLTSPRCRLTCLVTVLMYICLSLCEYTRNEVTSGNESFGILILYSRHCATFGVESPRGLGKPDSTFVILSAYRKPTK